METAKARGFVVWLTGLSGSGKTTLAVRLAEWLTAQGRDVERLDGDVLRGHFPGTGFTRQARDEHVKRVGYMASVLEKHGVIVIASFISPYREARRFVRDLCRSFVEVYVRASLSECERRDVKGLYARARAGQIENFTGLDDPYEPPERPELVVDSEQQSEDQSFQAIVDCIQPYLQG